MVGRIVTLFDTMSEAQIRRHPTETTNSIAWLIWHMARVEDAGVNRLVAERLQVLDEGKWNRRMGLSIRHHGTGMTPQEMAELSDTVDLPSLREYYEAVRARTVEVVQSLQPEQLDLVNGEEYTRRVLLDEGMLNPAMDWKEPLPYRDAPKGICSSTLASSTTMVTAT
ncbi:MAG: DinB family protein [Caldilineaceae bacterium]|nr:DinB family protein [Caldilineaceae bacterium]